MAQNTPTPQVAAPSDASVDVTKTQAEPTDYTTHVTLTGQVIANGATCPRLRLEDGQTISLERLAARHLTTGQSIQITGHFVEISRCMQGPAFLVTAWQDMHP
ncbi:hypothetical protein [Aestuariibius sp. HNIBRBA575]|uniref:hypothetical protein n=1 Tax=Aestuariibius sp. HNIBRBA575 TaxID=3233343 RepID=UPI0034A3D29F